VAFLFVTTSAASRPHRGAAVRGRLPATSSGDLTSGWATLRRTVGMDCELTDPDQTGSGSSAGLADELARAIDASERLGIDDLIVRLQPSTQPALDRLVRAIKIRGH